MTQTETTLERVIALIGRVDLPHGEPPKPDQQLFYVAKMESSEQARGRGNYGFDSLDRVEIVMSVEDDFKIEIPDCDVQDNPQWNTAEGIAAYVDGRLAQARS